MKCTETRAVVVTEVSRGDIFQFIQDSGCYSQGTLLVVQGVEPGGDAQFVARPSISGAFGSLEYLSSEISCGVLRYAGTLTYPDILNLEV